ncbi:alpha-mannosyltransferase [Lachancea thermotolerans CBS 6340]|uniref:KLTH0G19690p n=1 Tax=Lachancea thermotolerans (strain ATCC 56472 / CBS 6340 / NRRL Y-8284) TaxID=559295 RepID=C5DNT5_LACTC|nr:KLTH0G19690p [Lachancea thermotolerans CBS 6340]CAR25446.1 KLTH0G19690p [Lachancea thermotolerans CBS 6340]
MSLLTRKIYSARSWKRFAVLSLSTLVCFYVFQLANEKVSLRIPRYSAETGLSTVIGDETPTESPAAAEACAALFQSFLRQGSGWGMRSFSDRKSIFFSRRRVIQSVKYLRLYGHCFVTNLAPFDGIDYEELDSRLFPIFTRELPVFTRWDDTREDEATSVNEQENVKLEGSDLNQTLKLPFWRRAKDSMKDRGIVISFGEGGVSEVKMLLNVLRLLGNKLPIQLVHKGDVSAEAMQSISYVARNDVTKDAETNTHGFDLPQEIWFVNAKRGIKNGHHDLFKRFSNKWIASLFNSFDEMILMDSDAVPFMNPERFFDLVGYQETGAFFFKDRLIDEYLKTSDLKFYKKLLPTEEESKVFGIPSSTEKTTQNDFFKAGYKHLMESGVVVIKRSDHLPGLLISTALQLWKETSEPVYGDKELFWLGQSISGNENYRFNKNAAGALGILNRDEKRALNYTCSTQLAHFDEKLRLLWINGGLRNCKKPSWYFDFGKQKSLRRKFKSPAELEDYFKAPIDVDGAVIPARSKNSLYQNLRGKKAGFEKCPKMGCDGAFWSAFDSLNSYGGETIRFNPSFIKEIGQVIHSWNLEYS